MTDARVAVSLAATYDRVAAHLVGRERELTLALAAVAAGRDLILEGPPGTSKSTLLLQPGQHRGAARRCPSSPRTCTAG
jgi:MoxR-like ATPase